MPRVLVLDQERENLEYFQNLFRKSKAECIITTNVDQALEYFWKWPADIAIVNFYTSKSDGISIIEEFKKIKENVRSILLLKRNTSDHLLNMVRSIGINHILNFPLQDEDVKPILHQESLLLGGETQTVPYDKWWLRHPRIKLNKMKIPVQVTNSSLESFPEVPTFEGVVLDISEYGMALKLPSAFARFLSPNEVLHVEFDYLRVPVAKKVTGVIVNSTMIDGNQREKPFHRVGLKLIERLPVKRVTKHLCLGQDL
ncbi:MAG: response regulator [Bdellovibrionota bacterium]|nr:response regulator [Bdellovibrionota bacterium]